ncbi:MAG: TrmH family RNA methyltransferase, partial [Bacteroidota bacterium]
NPADHLGDKARMLGHGSWSVLENASVYSSFDEAIKDFDFVIGTSAKPRSIKHDYLPAEEISETIKGKDISIQSVALVFGREESGLTNDEILRCDMVSYISLANPYPSLNLGQAVMLYAYLLREFGGINDKVPEKKFINPNSYLALKDKARKFLTDIGFEEESAIYNRIMERLALVTAEDVNLLHSIEEKLRKRIGE